MIRQLFENFNLPEEPAVVAEPVAAEPLFSETALSAARQEAWNEGYLTASAAHASNLAGECRQVYAELLACSQDMDRKLAELAESNAASLARWLVGTFVAAFPMLTADRPDGRIRAVADLLQPVLRSQCRIEIRAGSEPLVVCNSMQDVWQQIVLRQAEEPASGSSAAGNPAAGDIIIAWPQGEACISSTKTWDDIHAAIMPLAGDATGDTSLQFTLKQRELLGHV